MNIKFPFTLKVASVAIDNYKKMDTEERKIVKTYFLILAIIFIIVWWQHDAIKTLPGGEALEALILAIWISLTFSIVDRLSILTPVEKKIIETTNGIKKLTQEMSQVSANMEIISNKNRKTIKRKMKSMEENLKDYGKYYNSRLTFGCNGLTGIDALQRKGGVATKFIPNEMLIIDLINDAHPNTTIKYMTSYVTENRRFLHAVSAAIQRGVSIKLFIMMPCLHAKVVSARHKDFLEDSGETKEEFVKRIRLIADRILRAREALYKDTTVYPHQAKFEVMFYTKSLNFPVVIVTRREGENLADEFALTGFYAGENAEQMPYIEWRGGDFEIIKRFHTLFDKKWTKCADSGLHEVKCKKYPPLALPALALSTEHDQMS